jgi:hypothetical protein
VCAVHPLALGAPNESGTFGGGFERLASAQQGGDVYAIVCGFDFGLDVHFVVPFAFFSAT